ncbi:MAG: hypothetical protein RIC03_16270 [Cyclobacteriaceae bacterium]
MNNRTFKIGEGEIQFADNKVIISDNINKTYFNQIMRSLLWMIFGFMYILRYSKTDDQLLLWSGVLIGVANLVQIVVYLFRSKKKEISNNEIATLKVKKWLGKSFLDIKLKNGITRRVFKLDDIADELKLYLQTEHNKDAVQKIV